MGLTLEGPASQVEQSVAKPDLKFEARRRTKAIRVTRFSSSTFEPVHVFRRLRLKIVEGEPSPSS
jgi:hypothetical protein